MTLRTGKLPQAMLADLLARIPSHDPRVVVGPSVGRDAAVIDLGDRLLVVKTDPVTFAGDRIGWYAVNVNANDVACMGARPAWFLATVLLPADAPDDLPGRILDDLLAACDALDIALIGGHTEVTAGIDRPIVSGTMLGESSHEEIVTGDSVAPGDVILLTRGVAIEGTALLAHESPDVLAAAGVEHGTVERAAAMLFDPGISVVADARVLCAATRPRLMHDPTEGGIATALHEMAQAAGMTLVVDPASIPVLAETRFICEALELDPLGLLASGALLAIVAAADAASVVQALSATGTACHAVGVVADGPARVILGSEDRETPFPAFARDELARFYDRATSETLDHRKD